MFNKDFYPTPEKLIFKMLNSIDKSKVSSILEPSAGKGNIVDILLNFSSMKNVSVDCIEKDKELQNFLKGKGYRVIFDDFLNLQTRKKYDLIIMNPPFSNGEKHLLKAIELMQYGGQIVCLLNAETINNICSVYRQDLKIKLEELNANIEFIEDAFLQAERKTAVKVALITINIPNSIPESDIFKNLKKSKEVENNTKEYQYKNITNSDFIKGIVERFNFEVDLGVKLINEYKKISPFLKRSFNDSSYPIFELRINDEKYDLVNNFLNSTRFKYWETLFQSKKFRTLFTTELRKVYETKLNELKNYDFNEFNILQIQKDMKEQIMISVENTILNLFNKLSYKHYYNEEFSKNIHYYNGWKSNSAYKINKKVIIPLNTVNWFYKNFEYSHETFEVLSDIEKVFNYINNKEIESIDLDETLKNTLGKEKNKNIECKYFFVTFYKKGTCHITFKDEDLLLKFNIFGSQKKGWLPPSYGKKKYSEMNNAEKEVIKEFQGEKEYNKIYNNPGLFSTNISNLIMIENGVE